ncbi:hypothetical protein L1273_24330, partial [Pseudoalteromonas sp. DL2-H6]
MKKYCLISIIFSTLYITGCDEDYNGIMREKVRNALGEDYNNYYFFSYPTDNFGIGTIHVLNKPNEPINTSNQYCATYSCLGLEKNRVLGKSTIDLDGFASTGLKGGVITFSENESKSLGLSFVLPQLFAALGLNGNFEKESVTRAKITLGQAYPRTLERRKFREFITRADIGADTFLREAFMEGRLAVVVSDVVIENMTVEIMVDSKLQSGLDAKLIEIPGGAFSDSQVGFKLSSSSQGTFVFEVKNPVILAKFTKKQPRGGELADENSWDDWI